MDRRSWLKSATLPLMSTLPAPWQSARAQGFPEKPVRIVVPFPPGNTLDTAIRLVGDEFRKNTGQPLIIDNRPGASGIVAAQTIMQAAPDAHTVLLGNEGMISINPLTFARLPYDPIKSFRSVSNCIGSSMVMAVNQGVDANNVGEFVSWVKSRRGKVSFASFSAGSPAHFAGVILNQRAGLNMLHVPFSGTPMAVQNLVGGQVDVAFLPLVPVKAHMESGRVKVLAVTSPRRSSLMPDVATFVEQGFADLEIRIWAGIFAPAATPDRLVGALNAEFVKVLNAPELREKWRVLDFEPLPSTPDELTQFAARATAKWAEAVKLSGFKAAE